MTIDPQSSWHGATGLNLAQRVHDAGFYRALADITTLRNKYIQKRAIFVQGEILRSIVVAFGATEHDIEALRQPSDDLGQDPTRPARRINSSWFSFDYEAQNIRRLRNQAFKLTEGDGLEGSDAGLSRNFREVGERLQHNTAVQALMVFKALMMYGMEVTKRQNLDYSANHWICNFSNVRVIIDERNDGVVTPEGVHADGSDHTMTVFLGSKNTTAGSGITYVHDKKETTGLPIHKTNPALVNHRFHHRHFLDTVLLADNEVQHSLTSLHQADLSKEATRDMLFFLTRKPRVAGHDSGMVDATESHPSLPMQIPLWLPC
ncbi:2OG-Fe dioxygenase-domain-containing protein [Penicillium canescens]|nr:2OG-Fe dioxygenase-domain-containing protein [Penicillium canescens]KAJ6158000.1 2OG-Fe dioxygenase-domain-containing protein [Penicillium canescens]